MVIIIPSLDEVMHHYKFHTVIMGSDKKLVWT